MKKIVTKELVRLNNGKMKVLAIFKTSKKDMIVGGRVEQGKIVKGDEIEIKRDDLIIGKAKIVQVRKGKNETAEAVEGEECGINYTMTEGVLPKAQEGDEICSFTFEERNFMEV